MAKFKFPFENVLRHRKTLENLAQKEFQTAMSELNQQLDLLEKMKQEKVDARKEAYAKQIAGGQAGPALGQIGDFLKLQDIRIEKHQKKIQEIEKRVEELREILRQRALDSKIIESYKDRKKDDFKLEQKKLEQKQMDDVVSSRFNFGDNE